MTSGTDKAIEISREVLSIAKAQLLVRMRFLDRALFELKPEPNDTLVLATDGRHLYYDPYPLLQAYRREQGHAVRVWGHILVHCLFRHMFVSSTVDHSLWDLACDMAAEAAIASWGLSPLASLSGQSERVRILTMLRKELKLLSVEKIYRYLLDHPLTEQEFYARQQLFSLDDHSLWYIRFVHIQAFSAVSASSRPNFGTAVAGKIPAPAISDNAQAAQGEDLPNALTGAHADALELMWKDISERMQTELETFSKMPGTEPGDMLMLLRDLHREKCDYRRFLRQFAARAEVMRVSPDEFDYVAYTLGLNLYKNMPLIDQLEYREDKRIREFVIAIDTSGSVSGELVRAFLQKTYTILKQEETFDRRFCLHIIQCDAEIQEDAVISSQEEFDRYIRNVQIRGLGGTDFCPVFDYVSKLQDQHQLRGLKGLIYFTDGYGTFPAKPPPYLTAFIFVESDARERWVPPWAIRQILEKEDIIAD